MVEHLNSCLNCGNQFLNGRKRKRFCRKYCAELFRKRKIGINRLSQIPDIEGELWMPMRGFENSYMVSSMGRVKSLITYKMVRPCNNGNGYLYFTPRSEKKPFRSHVYVHRIVAEHFLKAGLGQNEVNHINCIKSDNRVSNLEWVNRIENIKHAHVNGRMQKGENKFNAIRVKDLSTGILYETIRDAAVLNGLNYGTVKAAFRFSEYYKGLQALKTYRKN